MVTRMDGTPKITTHGYTFLKKKIYKKEPNNKALYLCDSIRLVQVALSLPQVFKPKNACLILFCSLKYPIVSLNFVVIFKSFILHVTKFEP